MPADPQPDEEFEAGLTRAFDRVADEVPVTNDPLVTGGLTRGRTRRRRRRIAAVTASCVVLGAVTTGGFLVSRLADPVPVSTSHAIDEADRTSPPPPHLDKGVNILLLGMDDVTGPDGSLPADFVRDQLHAGDGSTAGYDVTDTVVVLHLPANGGPATGVSVPRDALVQSAGPGGRMEKMNAIYAEAAAAAAAKLKGSGQSAADVRARSRDAGRAAVVATVQQLLGVPIDHLAEFDLATFYDVAKAIGPIQVCLNEAVQDRYSGADLKAGINTVDAEQALAFVRQRHGAPVDDLGRIRRQQAFIASALHTLKQQGVLSDLSKAEQLFRLVGSDLVVDSTFNPLDLLRQAPGLTDGRAEIITAPIVGPAVDHNGGMSASVWTMDPAKVRQVAQAELSDAASASAASASAGSPSAGAGAASPSAGAPSAGGVKATDGVPCVD